MSAIISEVIENSIADELEFQNGDKLISINGESPRDMIDYKFMMCSEDVEIEIEKNNGEIEVYEIEKDFDEDLGIVFESAVFDKIKPCTNHCIFCFVDQQPEGLRKTLYIKDDDYRLSYLQGTYITLTNLTSKDRQRIESMHLGPLYVSVHTTNPELRAKMLNNPKAANIMEDLKWLKKADIPIHAQVVLCPGYNDGAELERTLNDFAKFKSIIKSIAIVPVGITRFHKNNLKSITKEGAMSVIKQVERFNKKVKKQLAMVSDEFFIKCDYPIPEANYYGDFSQLEDGVGALRLFLDDFEKTKKLLPKSIKQQKNLTFAAVRSVKKVIKKVVEDLSVIKNLHCEMLELTNNFFGEDVIVAGLITGQDLINQAKGKNIENLVISGVMLRPYTDDFLDGVTLEQAEEQIGAKIHVIRDFYSTREFVEIINNL